MLLRGQLSAAIHKLNPHIPASARDDALAQVLDLGIPAPLSANRAFHKLLVVPPPAGALRVGQSGSLKVDWIVRANAEGACIITACNPFSAPTSDAENQRQQERLKAQIEAAMLRWLPAQGRDPSGEWPPEASLCVLDPPVPQIDEWRREYRQFAAVTLCPRTGCQLRWHPEVLA